MSDGDDSGRPPLVRMTVNLAPRAADALDDITTRTRATTTDAINRAPVAYNIALDLIERCGGRHLTLLAPDGRLEIVYLLL